MPGRKRNGCVRAIAAGNRKSQRECDCPQSTSEGSPLSQSASVPRSPQVPNAPPEFRVRDPRLERPDLQFDFTLWSDASHDARGAVAHPFPGFSLSAVHLRPDARGSVRIKSPDPLQPPSSKRRYA